MPTVTTQFNNGSFNVYADGDHIVDQPFDPRTGRPFDSEESALDWWESVRYQIHTTKQGLDPANTSTGVIS
jgi:hypothetical protein